jgi:hypothetical protein
MEFKLRVFFKNLRNIFGRFWANEQGRFEYYLKVDGYYFSKKRKTTIVVIQVRNKRTIEKIAIGVLINDKNILEQLHPADSCALGILATNERNGMIDRESIGWKNIKRLNHSGCNFIKFSPVLSLSKQHLDGQGVGIASLYSKDLKQEIEISAVEVSKNINLLSGLNSNHAIAIGCLASSSYFREKNRN